MAVNLRLAPDVAEALQAEAERSGRSQQDILREAVARHLRLVEDGPAETDRDRARADQAIRPARVRYRKVAPRLRLPEGMDSLDLLDRNDRL